MEQIGRKADIEALYTLHGPATVTVRSHRRIEQHVQWPRLLQSPLSRISTAQAPSGAHAVLWPRVLQMRWSSTSKLQAVSVALVSLLHAAATAAVLAPLTQAMLMEGVNQQRFLAG